MGEISVLLGYEESSSFYPPFWSWADESPLQIRAAMA
jgi:hypothetical protein